MVTGSAAAAEIGNACAVMTDAARLAPRNTILGATPTPFQMLQRKRFTIDSLLVQATIGGTMLIHPPYCGIWIGQLSGLAQDPDARPFGLPVSTVAADRLADRVPWPPQ